MASKYFLDSSWSFLVSCRSVNLDPTKEQCAKPYCFQLLEAAFRIDINRIFGALALQILNSLFHDYFFVLVPYDVEPLLDRLRSLSIPVRICYRENSGKLTLVRAFCKPFRLMLLAAGAAYGAVEKIAAGKS